MDVSREAMAQALAAACRAVGIEPTHAGAVRYERALAAALPFIAFAVLREVTGPCLPEESGGRDALQMGRTAMEMSLQAHAAVHDSQYAECPSCP